MPTPIPDWDLARRLVKTIGTRQIIGKTLNMREATTTLGIGRERLISILDEKKIIYKIFPEDETAGHDLLFLEYVPHNLALDASIGNFELSQAYKKFLDRQQQGKVRRKSRRKSLDKKQREKMQVKEFWSEKEQQSESP